MGNFRLVLYVGRFAIKLPRPTRFREARECNRWEREVWQTWRLKFRWPHLCPIIFADRFGLVVVMPRAVQPVTEAEVDEADPDDIHPGIDAEVNVDNWGRVNGRVVALDYGLTADLAVGRRKYYAKTAPVTLPAP